MLQTDMKQNITEKISTKDIETALKEMSKEYPGLFELHYTNMCNDKGEPLFLANVGTSGHPAFIGGTKVQLEERINRFFKELKNSI